VCFSIGKPVAVKTMDSGKESIFRLDSLSAHGLSCLCAHVARSTQQLRSKTWIKRETLWVRGGAVASLPTSGGDEPGGTETLRV